MNPNSQAAFVKVDTVNGMLKIVPYSYTLSGDLARFYSVSQLATYHANPSDKCLK